MIFRIFESDICNLLTKAEDKDSIFLGLKLGYSLNFYFAFKIFRYLEKYGKTGRARWGASGALSPTIRYSGVEFPVEAALFLDSVLVSGVDGQGPVQRALCEPRQDREVAAVAELPLVRQISLA